MAALLAVLAALALGLALTCAPSALAAESSPVSLHSAKTQTQLASNTQAKSLGAATVSVEDQTCTGARLTPVPKVTLWGKTLIYLVDYNCTYEDNVIPGTATVTVTGIGDYAGEKSATFEIDGSLSLDDASITVPKQTYTGSEVTPAINVAFSGQKLTAGKDYDTTFMNNVDAGVAIAIVEGKGSYTDREVRLFAIKKADLADATIGSVAAVAHTGQALEPTPSVSFEGKKLTPGVDYALKYENNVKAGKATISITGQGNFTGSNSTQFTIAKGSLTRARVTKIKTACTANGEAVTPTPEVIFDGRVLKEGTDYTLSYKNNTAPGTATLIVKGAGEYTGVAVKQFKIETLGASLARKACELSYSQQRWVKNGFKGTKAYLAAYNEVKSKSVHTPISCSVGMHVVMRAANYDWSFKINTAQDCDYLNFWSKEPGNSKWTYLGNYYSGMELQPGDILLGDKKKGVNHVFMYVGPEIAQEVYESTLKGTDADMGAPTGEWVSSHARYGGSGAALCISEWKTASAGSKHYKVFRCTKPDCL